MHTRLDAPPASLQATTRIPRGHERDRKKTRVLPQTNTHDRTKHARAKGLAGGASSPHKATSAKHRYQTHPRRAQAQIHEREATLPARPQTRPPTAERIYCTQAAHDAATDRASTLKETPSLSDEGASTPMQAQRTPSGAPKRAARGKCKKAVNASDRGAIAHRRSARTPRRVDADNKSADPARSAQRH